MKTITFNDSKIFFTESGKGKTIVLLHGFTETSKIWDSFRNQLKKSFRVIVIDLPGHGKSESVEKIHTMELQAEVVYEVLKQRKVRKCVMVGHSMGGYVALSFAAKYPEMLKGLCLFHSHPFPDSPADKTNRNRTVKIVEQDSFRFVAGFIPSLFPEGSRKKYAKKIAGLVKRAKEIPKEGIIAALEGMKVRKNQSAVLKSIPVPVLFIIGLKDPKAPLDRLWQMVSLPQRSECLILRNIGHMGYIEAPEETLNAVKGFARKTLKK
ncbi:MAG: alpha/beta fold hydrolase [Bacteroidetes bacterium]|nr:alpha/beta fold hydrolase [Bacteroidota bacterium]